MTGCKRHRPLSKGGKSSGPGWSADRLVFQVRKRRKNMKNQTITPADKLWNMKIRFNKPVRINTSTGNTSPTLPRTATLGIQSPIYKVSTSTRRTIGVESA